MTVMVAYEPCNDREEVKYIFSGKLEWAMKDVYFQERLVIGDLTGWVDGEKSRRKEG